RPESVGVSRARSCRALAEAHERASPRESCTHADHGDVVTALPPIPLHRDHRRSACGRRIAETLDVRVVPPGGNLALAADRFEHAQVRLVADEVKGPLGRVELVPEPLETAHGLVNRERLNRPPLLAEMACPRDRDLAAALRAGIETRAHDLGAAGSTRRHDRGDGGITK